MRPRARPKNNPVLKVAWSPSYKYGLPEGHRFPMAKYEILPEQLLYEGSLEQANFFEPGLLAPEVALLTHCQSYVHKLETVSLSPKEERAIGFPMSEAFWARSRRISQGTVESTLFALQHGVALNMAGGTHHAFADRGEGFCCLNDQAIAANYLLHNGLAQKILVVDLDVHQGNGTAKIFEDNPHVFTFSIHGANNYPGRKEHSSLDMPLPDGVTDSEYLSLLQNTLPRLFDLAEPDFVFYQAGVDVLQTDALGRLSLTRAGCKQRDRIVFEHCSENNLPVVVSMGGGYSPKLSDIIEAHANTFRVAQEVFF